MYMILKFFIFDYPNKTFYILNFLVKLAEKKSFLLLVLQFFNPLYFLLNTFLKMHILANESKNLHLQIYKNFKKIASL